MPTKTKPAQNPPTPAASPHETSTNGSPAAGHKLENRRAEVARLLAEFRAKYPPAAHPPNGSPDSPPAPEPATPPTRATQLVQLVRDSGAILFRDANGRAQLTFPVTSSDGRHFETRPLRSRAARHWIARQYHEATGSVPAGQNLREAFNVLEGLACHDGQQLDLHLRVGEHAGRIYIDLGDELWRAVEIDTAGWRLTADPPIRFRRSPAMLPLPAPAVPVAGVSDPGLEPPASQRPATENPQASLNHDDTTNTKHVDPQISQMTPTEFDPSGAVPVAGVTDPGPSDSPSPLVGEGAGDESSSLAGEGAFPPASLRPATDSPHSSPPQLSPTPRAIASQSAGCD